MSRRCNYGVMTEVANCCKCDDQESERKAHSLRRIVRPSLLDVFCGRGGWTKSFQKRGWWCVGVDLCQETTAEVLEYPGVLMKCNALDLTESFVNAFDAVTLSPPCEDFARAWLPWLRGSGRRKADAAPKVLEEQVELPVVLPPDVATITMPAEPEAQPLLVVSLLALPVFAEIERSTSATVALPVCSSCWRPITCTGLEASVSAAH